MVVDRSAQLVSWREVGPEVRHFHFVVPGIPRFDFSPGQFVSLTEEMNGKKITRAYSIASPPDENRFELSLNRVQEGTFSPYLFGLNSGDAVRFRGPYGVFTLREPARDTVFVAHGTGIAPFRSMLLARLPEDPDHQYTLLFGCRHQESLLYREELEQLERTHPNFRFLPTLSRPAEDWPGRRGRVQLHLKEVLDQSHDVDVYICGLKDMVGDVRQKLAEMGLDRRRIFYERYN